MERALLAVWTPLAPTPLLWLAVTLLAYIAGQMIRRLCRGSPLANPVLIAIIIMAALLVGTGTPYTTYFAGAQFINFLLGPATVALAVPLARNLAHVRRSFRGVGLALLAGSVTSAVSGVVVVWALGGGQAVALAMAPKAVTTPIAMALSQEIGGAPALTAALAIAGGIVAAVIGQTDAALAAHRPTGGRMGSRQAWAAAAWRRPRWRRWTGWRRRSRRWGSA